MEKIRGIHDTVGQTLTVWFDDPAKEYICEETSEEVVLIKDIDGHVIGFELLHYRQTEMTNGLAVETVIRTGPENTFRETRMKEGRREGAVSVRFRVST